MNQGVASENDALVQLAKQKADSIMGNNRYEFAMQQKAKKLVNRIANSQ